MNIYQEKLLEHYHEPHNFGMLNDSSATASVENLSCGDAISMSIKVVKGKIDELTFQGEGCAVAIASASILTDYARGKDIQKLLLIKMEDLIELIGIELTLSRIKCAGLSLDALRKAILIYLDQEGNLNYTKTEDGRSQ